MWHKLCTESWPASASQSHLGRLHTAALELGRLLLPPEALLVPQVSEAALPTEGLRVLVRASRSFPTPTLRNPLKASPSSWLRQSFKQAVLTPSLTHTHTLSPEEEIKSQMRGAAFLKQAHRSCVWGSPVNCQSSSYSESIRLAVLWNDMFARGDHTWSPSWSHTATKAVLRHALFTSMILWTFIARKLGWGVLEGDRVFIERKKDLWACQEHKPFKPFMPWPFYVFYSFPHDSIGTQHPHTQQESICLVRRTWWKPQEIQLHDWIASSSLFLKE